MRLHPDSKEYEELLGEIQRLSKRYGWPEFYRIVSHAYDDWDMEHLNDPVRGEDFFR